MSAISIKQLGKIIRKLHLRNGDILMIKKGSGLDELETIDDISKQIGETLGLGHCLLLVVNNLDDLVRLDTKAMYKAGWVQVDHLADLFQRQRGIDRSTTKSEIVKAMTEEDSDAGKDDTAPEPLQG